MGFFRRYRGAFLVTSLFALALSFSCLFAMWNSILLSQTQRSSNWLVSQLEVEYLRYNDALQHLYLHELSSTPDYVRLRFGIFESRIKTISIGAEGSELRETPHYRLLLPLLQQAESSSAALMPQLDPKDPRQSEGALRDLAVLSPTIHDWVMEVLLHNSTIESLRRSYYPVILALLGVLTTGIVLIVMLNRATAKAEDLVVTERQARQRADDANRAKDTFLAIASHEFKTPLNAIIGFSEVLLMPHIALSEAQRTQYLQDILSSGRQLARVVDDTLNLSRIATGKLSLAKERVDLGAILHTARPTLEALAAASEIGLQIDLPAGPVWIFADSVWLHQAIQNLVANAIKFSTAGDLVRLSCQATDTEVSIAVIDTGIGIPPEDLPRITEAFYQANHPLKRKTGGLGLGLAIADGVVRAHGGALTLGSEYGHGTTATISLPLASANRTGLAAASVAVA